jgi:Fic family protein
MTKIQERRKKILEYIKEKWETQISDLWDLIIDFWVDKKTIGRDLNQLIKDKLLDKEWALKSTVYKISRFYEVFEEIDLDEYFSVSYDKRKVLKTFNFELFDTLKEINIFNKEEIEKLEYLQKEFIKNIWKYDSQTLINKEYERIMIEFSWKSSSIEWNTYSLLATEALLRENIADDTKTKEETQMILNHKDAFNETLLNLDIFKKLSIQNIEYIHHILTKKLWISANIRKNIVWITGTLYKPLDNEFQIKEALQNMVELVNLKENFFEKAFLALLIISYIQAFEDGNKRTARMLTNAILLSNYSIPLSYRWVDIIEYKKAIILFYEKNNITYFKKIFIEQFEDAVKNYFS